jgi:hypothetical protein
VPKKVRAQGLKKKIHDGLAHSNPNTALTYHHQIETKLGRMIALCTIQCLVKF